MKYYLWYYDHYNETTEEVFEEERDLLMRMDQLSEQFAAEGLRVIRVIHGHDIKVEPVEKAVKWRLKRKDGW